MAEGDIRRGTLARDGTPSGVGLLCAAEEAA